MSKSTFFTGQPILSQLLSYLPQSRINQIASDYCSDHYCKKFTTHHHLVTMLYGIYNRCTSLREVTTGLQVWEHRIQHLGMSYQPRKSTLSDANTSRDAQVFEAIYNDLLKRFSHLLPDSRKPKKASKLYIADSTTITLFNDVLQGTGLVSQSGRRKGGIKVHTLIRSDLDVPTMIKFSAASACDVPFLKDIHLPWGSILVFDRGYRNYSQWNRFTQEGVIWVSRLVQRTTLRIVKENIVSATQREKGVVKDQIVELGHSHQKSATKVTARLIEIFDPNKKQVFQFITNSFRTQPSTIGETYRKRWQIEILFKRLKQNYPLRCFLGESENAIKVQIWCALIADLILKIISKNTTKKWSFSNLASMIRLHLMTYIDLGQFLKNPERALMNKTRMVKQISLFPT